MKTLPIKSLMFVAAIASLSAACGTSSPTGPDVSAIEAAATVSALRSEPGPGPSAPWPGPTAIRPAVVVAPVNPEPDPYPVPSPGGPSTIPSGPAPSPNDDTVPEPAPQSPNDDAVPAPPTTGIPAPAPRPEPTPTPAPGGGNSTTIPSPAPSGPSTVPAPAPPSAPPTTTLPTPPATVPPPSNECLAASVEIVASQTFAEPNSVALEAILLDEKGFRIEDSSCERLVWSVSGSGSTVGGQPVITYLDRANSRLVSVSGAAGTYSVRVMTPNEQAGGIQIDLF